MKRGAGLFKSTFVSKLLSYPLFLWEGVSHPMRMNRLHRSSLALWGLEDTGDYPAQTIPFGRIDRPSVVHYLEKVLDTEYGGLSEGDMDWGLSEEGIHSIRYHGRVDGENTHKMEVIPQVNYHFGLIKKLYLNADGLRVRARCREGKEGVPVQIELVVLDGGGHRICIFVRPN